jgi:hypothetical protein
MALDRIKYNRLAVMSFNSLHRCGQCQKFTSFREVFTETVHNNVSLTAIDSDSDP